MALERLRLDGQVAIITGAGRGIGQGLATVFAEAGATVVCAARTASEIEETAAIIRKAGGKALTRTCDVLRRADLIDLVQFTEREAGRIDIVLNNAGAIHYGPFLDITEEDFHWHINLNLTSAFLLSQAATPVMLKTGGGSIVNISSAVGRFGARGMMAYGAAKGGLENLTRGLAQELSPKIRCNAVALGAIMTPSLETTTYSVNPEYKTKLRELTPLGREGDAEDIGLCALYLCSKGCYATGAIFHVDGGLQTTNLPFRLPDL